MFPLFPKHVPKFSDTSEREGMLRSKHPFTFFQRSPIHRFRLYMIPLAVKQSTKINDKDDRVPIVTSIHFLISFQCPSIHCFYFFMLSLFLEHSPNVIDTVERVVMLASKYQFKLSNTRSENSQSQSFIRDLSPNENRPSHRSRVWQGTIWFDVRSLAVRLWHSIVNGTTRGTLPINVR